MKTLILTFLFVCQSVAYESADRNGKWKKIQEELLERADSGQIISLLRIVNDPEWREVLEVKSLSKEGFGDTYSFRLKEVNRVNVLVRIMITRIQTFLVIQIEGRKKGREVRFILLDNGMNGSVDSIRIQREGEEIQVVNNTSDLRNRIRFQGVFRNALERIIHLINQRPKDLLLEQGQF